MLILRLLVVMLAPYQLPVAAHGSAEVGHEKPAILQIGTAIPLVILDHLSTKTNEKGDLIHMEVAEDIILDGKIRIPKGSKAMGELTRCEAKGAFGKSGKLEGRALYVTLGGRTIRITGGLTVRGSSGTTATVLTGIAAGSLAFVVTGKSAEILPGTRVDAILDRNISL